MSDAVSVRAPCRLHFGMFRFGHPGLPEFGGVGMMVDSPAVELTIRPADHFVARGFLASRIEKFAQAAAQHWRLPGLPACEIVCQSSPREHRGLGVGTQLGLAVAAGLRRFLELPDLSAEALAGAVGRGRRSAVGTFGFLQGGLLFDGGKLPGQPLGRLTQRVAVPDAWRVVLVCPDATEGLAGQSEEHAFTQLPPIPPKVTKELLQLTEQAMLPALERADCEAFGEAVTRYGHLAGECFASTQGGPFASKAIAQMVKAIRGQGIAGVGQSSWGPTLFAITSQESEALELADWLQTEASRLPCEIVIARPNNHGAVIEP